LIKGWDWKEKSINKRTKKSKNKRIKIDIKNQCSDWRVKLKKIITLQKYQEKKLEKT